MTGRPPSDPIPRIMQKVERVPFSTCWIFIGNTNSDGYGLIGVSPWPKRAYVHRLMYERSKGQIDPGLEIDHLCRVRCCCNPDHLEAVTSRENTRRGLNSEITRRRHAQKTHCPQGHPYSGDNLHIKPDGDRVCKTCRAEQKRRARSGAITPEPPPPAPDKKAIAAALKAGQEVPGCRLTHGMRLEIK